MHQANNNMYEAQWIIIWRSNGFDTYVDHLFIFLLEALNYVFSPNCILP